MANNNNPFEAFQAWGENFKNPSFDFETLAQANQRSAETAAKASQKIAENAQALARRNTELLQQQAEGGMKLAKELVANANNPEVALSKQADFLKSSFDASFSNSRELFKQASEQSAEALDALNKQFNDFWKEASKAASAAQDATSGKKKANVA